jgi:hypothetical protein
MKARPSTPRKRTTVAPRKASGIAVPEDWRERTLSQLRELIEEADPDVIEEMKWKKPSNPEGVPVWSHDGMICVANVLKNAVRLTFPNGPEFSDPKKLFNTRLDSKVVRAIDYFEGVPIDEAGLRTLILQAVALNTRKRAVSRRQEKHPHKSSRKR